jgi:hypothetical protein
MRVLDEPVAGKKAMIAMHFGRMRPLIMEHGLNIRSGQFFLATTPGLRYLSRSGQWVVVPKIEDFFDSVIGALSFVNNLQESYQPIPYDEVDQEES